MNIKKKTAMLVSFALGALLFATTALADMASNSGYGQLKDALKATAEDCTNKFDNFTLSTSTVIKDNGKTVFAKNRESKWDRRKNSIETVFGEETTLNPKTSHYYYFDQRTQINGWNGEYNVVEFDRTLNRPTFTNPFKEPQTEDIEKIADAILGSIKDRVVVTENADGSKTFSGSLTEVEIPPIVNAGASLLVKQQYLSKVQQATITQDIFATAVKGKAVVNKNDVMESLLGNVVLHGKDQQGRVHEITIEFQGKLSGINSTTVSKPDLTEKKQPKANGTNQTSNPQKYVGKYKNDIVIEKNGKFVKIGERILDVTHVDNKSFAARYHEEYKSGFEEYSANTLDITFAGELRKERDGSLFGAFTYTNKSSSDNQGRIFFEERIVGQAGLILRSQITPFNSKMPAFDTFFSPVLE